MCSCKLDPYVRLAAPSSYLIVWLSLITRLAYGASWGSRSVCFYAGKMSLGVNATLARSIKAATRLGVSVLHHPRNYSC
jgi:hypothetical protein